MILGCVRTTVQHSYLLGQLKVKRDTHTDRYTKNHKHRHTCTHTHTDTHTQNHTHTAQTQTHRHKLLPLNCLDAFINPFVLLFLLPLISPFPIQVSMIYDESVYKVTASEEATLTHPSSLHCQIQSQVEREWITRN